MNWQKIQNKLLRMRLQPIRVFGFHHVSDTYDPLTMWDCDWIQTEQFKQYILNLKAQGYTFISLEEAHQKLKQDVFRIRKYAVITADDGFRSLFNILPWLEQQKIPVTLFVNPKYIQEDAIGLNVQHKLNLTNSLVSSDEMYLKMPDILKMQSPLISFAYHGYEHFDEFRIDETQFIRNLEQCINAMQASFPNVIPFYAHTNGHAKKSNDRLLIAKGIVPVYINGQLNYDNCDYIDRELISNERLQKKLLF